LLIQKPLAYCRGRRHGPEGGFAPTPHPGPPSQAFSYGTLWPNGLFCHSRRNRPHGPPLSFFILESASMPLVGFGVLNDNLIKCLISFVEVHEQILSNRYKGIHGYITQSTIMMQMELCDQCV
jgi:hypothetical protein